MSERADGMTNTYEGMPLAIHSCVLKQCGQDTANCAAYECIAIGTQW